MKNKLPRYLYGSWLLSLTLLFATAPTIFAQSNPWSIKTNSTTVSSQSHQFPAAFYNSSWTVFGERIDGEGEATIRSVDPHSFIIPNTSTSNAPESTQATVVYDNGPHINVHGDPDLSLLESTTLGMSTVGASIANDKGQSVADDFELVAETEITSIAVYAYQSGATSTTINGMFVTIWDGDPSDGASSVIWGDNTTNVFGSVEDSGVYRVPEFDLPGRDRLLQKVNADISGLILDAGTYWLQYSLAGTLSSGPWQTPIVILGENTTGDALLTSTSGWSPWVDLGTGTPQGIPFQIEGIASGGGGGHVYCIPEGTNSGRFIDNFSTTGGSENISNIGSGFSPDGYGDFYDTHTVSQEQGEDVEFSVDIEGGTAGFRVWVDWNQDGVFDETEEVAYASSSYIASHTGSITVPADALEGDTRMRIVSHWLSTSGDVDPCETGFTYGEFEDYKFTVEEGIGGGGGPGSITTIYDGGNNSSPGGAVYFDVTVASEDIELTALDLNIDSEGTSFTVEVYTIEGTYAGNETDQSAWTLQTEGSGTSAGEGNPSNTQLDDTFVLSANTTYGMALVMTSEHRQYYTNGDGTNEHFENDDLELDLGSATNTPFTPTAYSPRVFNGTLYYNVGGGAGGDDCGQGDDSNAFENAFNITEGLSFRNADDFFVSPDNTLNIRSIELNIFADAPVDSININFFEDDGGAPGSTVVESLTGLVPYAQVPIGGNFGYTVYAVYVEVDLDFEGGSSGAAYWMQPEAVSATAFWEVTTLGTLGEPIHTSEAMGPWEADDDGAHAVFKLHCDVATPPDPQCLFDITVSVEPITRVLMAGIDNTSSPVVDGSPALEDFTSIEGAMSQDTTYDVALEGNTDGSFTNYFTVWIDWDQDGEWDSSEMYEIGSINNSTGTDGKQATGTISVPADAVLGATTMRVIKNFNSSPTDPCGQYSYGQGEDYTIIVDDELGIDDQSSTSFSYYPNPTNSVVNITANKDISSVAVFNILGQQVLAKDRLDEGQVDVSALSIGTYIFRVIFEDGSIELFKVLKE